MDSLKHYEHMSCLNQRFWTLQYLISLLFTVGTPCSCLIIADMDRSLSFEYSIAQVDRIFPKFHGNPKVHERIYKRPPLVHILNRISETGVYKTPSDVYLYRHEAYLTALEEHKTKVTDNKDLNRISEQRQKN